MLKFLVLFFVLPVKAEIKVAVASNFAPTFKEIQKAYPKKVTAIYSSTGKHYAQIKNGAPFDLFLSADTERANLLEGDKAVYAKGRLVLWARNSILDPKKIKTVAMANPKLAPYGEAARIFLKDHRKYKGVKKVYGENISQAYQFVKSGNVDHGLLALSQVINLREGAWKKVPSWPIEQKMVLLNEKARPFFEFLQGPHAQAIMKRYGYEL